MDTSNAVFPHGFILMPNFDSYVFIKVRKLQRTMITCAKWNSVFGYQKRGILLPTLYYIRIFLKQFLKEESNVIL